MLDNKDIDAVTIGTPDHWHCYQMIAACEAGKDVYVEKPLANSIKECDLMVDSMLGVQANFDSNGNITDVRFGFDSGVSVAVFGGLELSIQLGGIYVFE